MARTVQNIGLLSRHSRVLGALVAGGILFVIGFGASGALMGIRGEGLNWGAAVLAQVAS